MPDIYLSDLRWSDWWTLYKIARYPGFFYRALNDQGGWASWRALRYIGKAKLAAHFQFMRRVAKAIHFADTHQFIGCVVLTDMDASIKDEADIGVFVSTTCQGRGIGTVALLRFIDWCLERFTHLQSMRGTAHPGNKASLNMQARLGFKETDRISAIDSDYRDREGRPEPRVVMRGSRADIEQALSAAREQGLYSRSIPVL